jgi:hypothetical protein
MTQKLKTICCECGRLIHDGPQPDSEVSHGICRICLIVIMDYLEGRPYDREYAKKIKSISP